VRIVALPSIQLIDSEFVESLAQRGVPRMEELILFECRGVDVLDGVYELAVEAVEVRK
jgi:hypothetical protein